MPRHPVQENNRISIRVLAEDKNLLMRAASLENTDLTSFVLQHTVKAARDIIDKAERVALSERDSARVLELLDAPPRPTDKLRAAARKLPPLP